MKPRLAWMVGVGAIVIVIVGVWLWQGPLRRAAIADGVPPSPDLTDAPILLVEKIAAAETRAAAGELAGLRELAWLYQANGYTEAAMASVAAWQKLAPVADTGAGPPAVWDESLLAWCFVAGQALDQAIAAIERGDEKLAVACVERAVALAPSEGREQLRIAFLWERLRRQVDALPAYEIAVTLDPGLVEGWLRLITLNKAIGETSKAVRLLRDALAANPGATALRLENGRALLERGRPEEALENFEAVIAAEPTAAPGYLEAAQVLFALQRPADGVAMLERSLAVEPGNPLALVLLTAAAYAAGDQVAADRWYREMMASPRVAPPDRAQLTAGYAQVFGVPPPQ